MPKGLNLKNFGRRKSSGNALEIDAEASAAPPQSSSFRVLERPSKTSSTYGSLEKVRTFNSPLRSLRGKSVENLGLSQNRGSGGTTNSGSSGYYDSSSASARHSSTSTLPSSLDQDRVPNNDEELFPPVRKSATTGMYQSVVPSAGHPPPPPPPSFSTRAARALSFGNKNGGRNSKDIPPVPPPHAPYNVPPVNPAPSHSPHRERAMTQSSYASTAVPPKTELTLSSDFGSDDFGTMFDTAKKQNPTPPPRDGVYHRTESEPMFPPRTHSRNAFTPSPNHLKLAREGNNSPYYSSDYSGSHDGLVSASALSSPNTIDGKAAGPAVGNGIAQAFLGTSKSGYAPVPERYTSPGPERSPSIDSYSSVMEDGKDKEVDYPNRQTHVEDEDRWVRRVELSDAPMPSPAPAKATPVTRNATLRQPPGTMQAAAGAPRPRATSPMSSGGDSFTAESNTSTPRAARIDVKPISEHSMYDSSPVGVPSRAVRPVAHQRGDSGGLKKMTKAQFQALQRRGENSSEQSEEDDLSDNEYDYEDDADRAKRMATQRRKQEANMSVYRQQMKKVTGGGPTDLPSSGASTIRPSVDRNSTAPAATNGGGLHFGGIGGTPPTDVGRGRVDEDDEDDDVPLGILQAHGFPTGNRPPTRAGDNDIMQQRRTSAAGSVVGGGAGQGNLPPFARRLPQDPYFGAGLVSQQTRESLAMNSSGASVVGMPTGPMGPQMQPQGSSMGHPGGLVGVIAGEERARAARRGSPNTANMMGNGMPLPHNMNMPPPMPRTMSMGNLPPPSMYGGAPPMPMMPQMNMGMGMGPMGMPPMMGGDAGQQQMQQFMSMQMQLMQNMINMQQAQMGQGGPMTPHAQQQQPGDYLGVNMGNTVPRPMSMASQTSSFQPTQGRAMTMSHLPTGWAQTPPAGAPRPTSALPMGQGSYAPSVSGLNISGGGPGPGYTPSIAPSERSNIGMPSRYRPVTQNGDQTRSQSMTSSLTLQAFTNQQTSPNPGTPFNATQTHTPKSTIRIVDKPKGSAKLASRPAVEDEDDGWADMRKKRDEKKRFKWGRKNKPASSGAVEPSLSELYQGLD